MYLLMRIAFLLVMFATIFVLFLFVWLFLRCQIEDAAFKFPSLSICTNQNTCHSLNCCPSYLGIFGFHGCCSILDDLSCSFISLCFILVIIAVKTDVSYCVGVSRLYFNFLVYMDNDGPKVLEGTYIKDIRSVVKAAYPKRVYGPYFLSLICVLFKYLIQKPYSLKGTLWFTSSDKNYIRSVVRAAYPKRVYDLYFLSLICVLYIPK